MRRRAAVDTFRHSMRQRSLTQRLVTALFGVWFCLLVAEPLPLHVCPMHDGLPPSATAGYTADLSEDRCAPPGQAAITHAPDAHDAPATDTPAGHAAHQCLCLGCCAGTPAIALPGAPVVNVPCALADVQVLQVAARNDTLVATRFAHVLPFANGPPPTRHLRHG
ncbi:MAG: hypothetical protein IT355_13095 [Gemmatimonadaceae bacterium]|nr:hypothetical protein [Gemmatimonadaceae bacterium]